MKKLITILSFLLLWQGMPAKAQPYQSIFGDPTTKWVFVWYNLPGNRHDTAYIEKDTIVNGIDYKKVVTWGASKTHGLYKGGLLRENVDSGLVWYRDIQYTSWSEDTVEKVIFDFRLQPGDTFDISNVELQPATYPDSFNIVDSVRVINGLKHIYFKGRYDMYDEPYTIIEGVGSNVGIIWKSYSSYQIGAQYLLCSYKAGQKTGYVNKYYNGICWQYSDVKDTQLSSMDISIYPQPAHGILHISNNTVNKITRGRIINLLGQHVLSVNDAELKSINVGNMSQGYYLLELQTINGQTITLPMAIQ